MHLCNIFCIIIIYDYLLVGGAFSVKEKSPTITVCSFFPADNLTLNGPLFLQFLQSYNFIQFLLSLRSSIFTSSKKLNGAKGIFGSVRLFFENFFHRRAPFNFLIFSDKMDVEKSQRVPLSVFFGIVRLFSIFL